MSNIQKNLLGGYIDIPELHKRYLKQPPKLPTQEDLNKYLDRLLGLQSFNLAVKNEEGVDEKE